MVQGLGWCCPWPWSPPVQPRALLPFCGVPKDSPFHHPLLPAFPNFPLFLPGLWPLLYDALLVKPPPSSISPRGAPPWTIAHHFSGKPSTQVTFPCKRLLSQWSYNTQECADKIIFQCSCNLSSKILPSDSLDRTK